MSDRIKLGISTCLLGENVRYDGGHARDRFLTDTLSQYVEYVPVCPEVECGFPIPRETFRLVGDPDAPRLVMSKTNDDHTERMTEWARKRVRQLKREDLCGFIFKSRSPSSGMERVKVYDANGVPSNKGVGIFARAFMEHFPLLPVEEDGRIHDTKLRENFVESIFTMARWREALAQKPAAKRLVEFHSRHKLLIMSHSVQHYRLMGKLVADTRAAPLPELYGQYEQLLLEAVRLRATPKKHANVLTHILGYFKKQLSSDEKQELLDLIEHYRQGLVPLIVPITLANHYVRKYDQPYLKEQYYLNPHPTELQLRNHV